MAIKRLFGSTLFIRKIPQAFKLEVCHHIPKKLNHIFRMNITNITYLTLGINE